MNWEYWESKHPKFGNFHRNLPDIELTGGIGASYLPVRVSMGMNGGNFQHQKGGTNPF